MQKSIIFFSWWFFTKVPSPTAVRSAQTQVHFIHNVKKRSIGLSVVQPTNSPSHSRVEITLQQYVNVWWCCVKPRPHQQQCRSNVVECYKLNDSFDRVERNCTCSIFFDFVERTKFYDKLVRHCCRFWQQSRALLGHCCWCGRGFTRVVV